MPYLAEIGGLETASLKKTTKAKELDNQTLVTGVLLSAINVNVLTFIIGPWEPS